MDGTRTVVHSIWRNAPSAARMRRSPEMRRRPPRPRYANEMARRCGTCSAGRGLLQCLVLLIGEQPGADQEPDALGRLDRESAAAALHDVDREVGVLPVLELRARHPEPDRLLETVDAQVAQVDVRAAGLEVAVRVAH